MRTAKIILMTLVFSVILINLIFAIAFDTWYTYSGWFLALWFAWVAFSIEIEKQRLIEGKDHYLKWDMFNEKIYKRGNYNVEEIRAKENA